MKGSIPQATKYCKKWSAETCCIMYKFPKLYVKKKKMPDRGRYCCKVSKAATRDTSLQHEPWFKSLMLYFQSSSLLIAWGKQQQQMGQGWEHLPPTEETQVKLLAPVWPSTVFCIHLGERTSRWKTVVFPSLSLSVSLSLTTHSLFQINKSLNLKKKSQA